VLMQAMLIVAMFGAEPDPRTIPAGERIAYVNRLADRHKGRDAAKYHQQAAERFVPLHQLYWPYVEAGDLTKVELYQHVERNLHALWLAARWRPDEQRILEEWVKANSETLQALAQAYRRKRCYQPVDEGTRSFVDIEFFLEGMYYAQLQLIVAATAALHGEWEAAYTGNLCVHRLATHAYQQPLDVHQLMAMTIERLAQEQLRWFLRCHPPADWVTLKEQLASGDDMRCPPELLGVVGRLYLYDTIEAWHEWATNAAKHPYLSDMADAQYGAASAQVDAGLPPDVSLPKSRYQSVEELRAALQQSSVEHDWAVALEAQKIHDRWDALPFHEAWRTRDDMAKEYCEKARSAPALEALGCSTWALTNSRGLAVSTELERTATFTIIALLQHRQEEGRFPAALSDLVPKYLREVPIDSFSGQPLPYRLTKGDQDFILYSIGQDQKDDQGVAKDPMGREGDVVYWPPAEVKVERD